MQILHTVLYTFPEAISWWSFPRILWPNVSFRGDNVRKSSENPHKSNGGGEGGVWTPRILSLDPLLVTHLALALPYGVHTFIVFKELFREHGSVKSR